MTSVARWRVIGPEVGEAETLLAEGVALLEGLATRPEPILRWYRARTPALVLGRGQGRLAVTATPSLSVHVRHSGGGAVLLDPHLLNLDVLLPAGHPWLDDDLGRVFLRVGAAWASALTELGVPGVSVHRGPGTARRRGTAREQLLAAVCYATVGRGEVLVEGRKLVGLSQRRRRPGALVQCGLLERWAPAPMLRALGAEPDDAEILQAAVGLVDLLPTPPDEARIRAVVERAFRAASTACTTDP